MVGATVSSQLIDPGFLISFLSMLATVMGVFFTVVAAFLGFLAWKQHELRKKAEEDVRQIDKLRKGVERAKEKLDEMTGVYGGILEKMKSSLDEIETKGEATRSILEQVEKDKEHLGELSSSVDSMLADLEEAKESLTTVSGMAPDYSIDSPILKRIVEAEEAVRKRLRDDLEYLRELGDKHG